MQPTKMICRITQKGLVFDWNEFQTHVGAASARRFLSTAKFSKTHKMGDRYQTRESCFYKIIAIPSEKRTVLVLARFMLDAVIDLIKTARAARDLQPEWTAKNQITQGDAIDPERLEPGPTLDSNQQAACDYLMDTVYTKARIARGSASCTLVMAPGAGKSYMAAALVGQLGRKTLFIAPTDAVMDETRKALAASYPTLNIGEYTSRRKADGDVVLMIINSALSNEFKFGTNTVKYYDYFAKFGVVIFDEIHNYTSEVRQEIFWRTNFMYGLGLTATPSENRWEMDIVFQKHVGPLIIDTNIPGYNMKQIDWKAKLFPIEYSGPASHIDVKRNAATGWTSYIDMIKQFNDDPYRTQLLLQLVTDIWERGRNAFVFLVSRDYVTELSKRFLDMIKTNITSETSDDAVILMGGVSGAELEYARKASIIFTTYSFSWQGISIPKMDTIVLADPRISKMKQILGRGFRKGGDVSIIREIYDMVDIETALGKKEHKERMKFYNTITSFQIEFMPAMIRKWSDISLQ
jgi:superfamily II DNA or RNA helicase